MLVFSVKFEWQKKLQPQVIVAQYIYICLETRQQKQQNINLSVEAENTRNSVNYLNIYFESVFQMT